ncbi:MAG TPA: Smr/MutS family protein [Gammaproteobacteria bacterium]|nr:Smr/MutS family protein [Gammaproteobacteria bacterium]
MAKRTTPKLPDEDIELFRQETKRVTPLRHDKAVPAPKRPAPVPRQTQLDEVRIMQDLLSDDADAAEVETGEELLFSRQGLQYGLLRKLRRGQFSINAQLDLHGMTVEEARGAVSQFLADCQAINARCVRIIHGKGYGSRHKQPVLKNKVNSWLQQRDDVLAFCSARPADGGTGAVYVLLKRR